MPLIAAAPRDRSAHAVRGGRPSTVDADQRSLAVYGLWRRGEHLFVDGLLANGRLDFDLTRWSELANASAQATRSGD